MGSQTAGSKIPIWGASPWLQGPTGMGRGGGVGGRRKKLPGLGKLSQVGQALPSPSRLFGAPHDSSGDTVAKGQGPLRGPYPHTC